MKKNVGLTSLWPGVVVAIVATVVAAAEWLLGQSLCGWEFCYPLDDTYIHMALARQLATSGTWGLEPGVPVFASSSPLWTVVLAIAFKLFGAREWMPLLLSYIFAFGSVILAFQLWNRAGLRRGQAVLSGLALVVVIPFTTLSNLGMEHALHFFFVEATLLCAWKCLSSEMSTRKDVAFLLASAALATGARYESLFIVAPIAALFAFRRRFALAGSLMAAAFLPVVAMGLYAVSCGRPFFPASLLLKANVGGVEAVSQGICNLYNGISSASIHFHLAIVLLLVVAAMPQTGELTRGFAFSLAIAMAGHFVFAKLGWLYRYEAYLMGAAFTILPLLAVDGEEGGKPKKVCVFARWARLLLFVGVTFPFLARSFKAQYDTTAAQREIFGQQMQMGRIFESLPEQIRGPVAINDLGCVAYFSGLHILDVWGLGTPEVAELARTKKPIDNERNKLFEAHRVRYAAVYDFVAGYLKINSLSNGCTLVATLTADWPFAICAGNTVLLYAMSKEDAGPFEKYLREFTGRLPKGVHLNFVSDQK